MIVPLLFFGSGATALIYEVIWSKYLALMLGSTVQAQTVVLAVFMGGLALGNRIFGGRADRARSPLAIYGYLEVCIGLYAFFFEHYYRIADSVFIWLGAGRLEQGTLLFLLKGVLSVGLLLGPTLLMGGTLPLLASWLQRRYPDGGRWSARFYSINSLGAVFGSGLAGFLLVRELGLVSALQLTALVNVLIGITAVGASRYGFELEPRGSAERAELKPADADSKARLDIGSGAVKWGCWCVAISGGISMGFEVLAARSLVMIFGASLQAFAIVLMAFIMGIGIGSSVVASPRWKTVSRESGTAWLMLGGAALVGLLVMGIETWVHVFLTAKTGLAPTDVGFRFQQGLAAGMSMVVLGIPAGLLGGVLPLWIRGDGETGNDLGDRVGRLLTYNTLGAVAGVLTTGFLLMPTFGLRGAYFILITLLCAAAASIALAANRRRLGAAAAAAGLLLGGIGASTGEGWRQVLSSGIFRMRGPEVDLQALENRKRQVEILFYRDAADATVSVEKVARDKTSFDLGLRINGKVDASSRLDMATQYLLAHLPMLARPGSEHAFILGLGSGVTAGSLLGHPGIQRVDIAENCAPVLEAARFFQEWNRGVLTNRAARFWPEDARTVLKLTPQRYDILISEPSNPWMAGIGSVFSREFYQLAASRLKPGGVMAQWFHIYEMNDTIVDLVLRTFALVFPHMEIWDPGAGDIILLGSRTAWQSDPSVYRALFARPEVAKDFAEIGMHTPESLWARQLASQRTAALIPDEGPVQSDLFPILEYEAPKAFYKGSTAHMLNLFDERTWQSELAEKSKREAMASLPDEQLQKAFGQYASVNLRLNEFLKARANASKPESDVYVGRRLMPCAFRKPGESNPIFLPVAASDPYAALCEAERQMRTEPSQWRSAVLTICERLASFDTGGDPARTRGATEFAAAAFRAASVRGEQDLARRALAAGLKLEPLSPELRFLARFLERVGGTAQPAAVEKRL